MGSAHRYWACKTGTLCDYVNHPVTSVQVAEWRSCFADECPSDDLDRRLIVVDTPRFECSTRYAYQRMRKHLDADAGAVTALVCTSEESAVAAL